MAAAAAALVVVRRPSHVPAGKPNEPASVSHYVKVEPAEQADGEPAEQVDTVPFQVIEELRCAERGIDVAPRLLDADADLSIVYRPDLRSPVEYRYLRVVERCRTDRRQRESMNPPGAGELGCLNCSSAP